MKLHTPISRCPGTRAFVASLIAYIMLAAPLAPLAAASNVAANRPHRPVSPITERGVSKAAPIAAPMAAPLAAANLVVTKADSFADPNMDGKADPGQTITYTVTIENTGNMDATNVTMTDTVDPNTTIVGGSVAATPLGNNDTYNVIGNVRIQPNSAQGVLANDRDTNTGNMGAGAGLTASGPNSGPSNGQLTLNSDGSFSYDPNAGFNGTDTFTYTVTDSGGRTGTATVTLTVGDGAGGTTGAIWFVNPAADPGGDGRLTNPFNCFVGTNCFDDTTLDEAGESIFLYTGAHTGGQTLLSNQKLVGQGATATLASISGYTVQPYSDPLPANNSNPSSVTITTTVAATNAIILGQGNTLRGFTVGNTTGAKISGNNFGTLIVGNSASPDVVLNGTGQALSLTNGTLSTAGAFSSVTTTSSGGQGILVSQVADSDGVGGSAFSFGSTTVSGSTTQGILFQQSTADINFGNTSVTGGTDGISLQNNSAGTRTFGTLTRTGGTGAGFLHAAGGGVVNVTGATNITNTGGAGISITSSNADISFAATNVDKGSTSGFCVSITSNAGRTTTFSSLDLNSTNATGSGLFATNGGTINVTNAAGSEITAPQLIDINVAMLGLNFTNLASTGGPASIPAIRIIGAGGALNSTTTNIQNSGNFGLNIDGNSAAFNFGNTTVNGSGGTGVFLNNNTNAITFAALNISPNANQPAFHATNNTGTISSSSGAITATSSVALDIAGASAAARTPLAMTLTSVTSNNSASASGGVNINFASGNLTVGTAGGGVDTNIQNPNLFGIQIRNSVSGTFNFNDTTVNSSGGTGVVLGTASNGNTNALTFAALNITPDPGQRALIATHNTGMITTTSGTISTTNAIAVEIVGQAAATRTPINVRFTSVSALASGGNPANGIILTNTSAPTASTDGFRVLGNGGTCTSATPTCTGGRIQSTTGAEDGTPEDNAGIGVRLFNAQQVFLTRMRIDNHSNFAIHGTNVVGFNLDVSVIDGNNGTNAAFEEGAIGLRELTGTSGAGTASSITNSFISGGREFLLDLRNFSGGTLNRMTISNNTFGNFQAGTDADDAVRLEGFGSGATFNVTFSNNVVQQARGDMVNFNVGVTGNNPINSDFVMRGNTLHNTHPTILSGGGGSTITMGGGAVLNSTYDISCNSIRGSKGFGLLVAKTLGSGTAQGTIFNNTIGQAGVAGSASTEASGLNVDSRGAGTHTVLIKNNRVHGWGANGAYQIFNNQGSVTMNVTVQGNLSTLPHPANALAGLYAEVGALSGDTSILNLLVGGAGAAQNDFRDGDPFNGNDVLLSRIAGAGTQFNLSRGVSAQSTVQGVISDNNVNPVTAAGAGVINFVNTTPALPPAINESCTPPSAAPVEADPNSPGTGATEGEYMTGYNGGDQPTSQAEGEEGTSSNNNVTSRPFLGMPSTGGVNNEQPDGSLGVVYGDGRGSGTQPPSVEPPADGTIQQGDTPAPKPPVIMGDTITFDLGTIPAGKSITVTFQVVIDDPFTGMSQQVSNQATVTADGGISVMSNTTVTPINASQEIAVRDAKVAEPTSGTTPMIFTVVLSSPASGTVTVNYATANDVGGTNPATGGSCANGDDYESTSGTVTFSAGQSMRTVSVNVCSDANTNETDETFLLNISNPSSGNIVRAQAVGTITPINQPATVMITELRASGPAGPDDEFVEIYNNTGADLTVAASDASAGYGIFKMGATCDSTPVLVGTIPNGAVIPDKGHYLLAGNDYSLGGYAMPDETLSSGIDDNANLALFTTTDVGNISTATRLDAVGFGTNTGSVCDILREGDTLAPANGSMSEYSFLREQDAASGHEIDTNNSASDFFVVSTTPTTPVGDNTAPRLGAPGPQNSTAPTYKGVGSDFASFLVAPCLPQTAAPNRARDATPGDPATSSLGTLAFRRTYINQTGADVQRLRFRIIDITTFPAPSGTADLRAISSGQVVVSNPCGGGTLTIEGTTLEEPPNQPNGGGMNSTLSAGTITLATPLQDGEVIHLQFMVGVQQSGAFRFFVIIEAGEDSSSVPPPIYVPPPAE